MSNISFLWSRVLLTNRSVLWLLFWVNLAGTVYGYIWYGDQLAQTYRENPLWQIVFVPDSPTASLFFTLALLFLLFPPKQEAGIGLRVIRKTIEALAVVTSVKYGIWAVAMIIAGAMRGDQLVWQHYMLIASHLAMAVEGLLYTRFFVYGRLAAFGAACWLFLNDYVDYSFGVYPWLPRELDPVLSAVRDFTFGLSLFSLLLTWLVIQLRRRA